MGYSASFFAANAWRTAAVLAWTGVERVRRDCVLCCDDRRQDCVLRGDDRSNSYLGE